MKHKKFTSRAKAEDALSEVLEQHPASIIGSARNWMIEGHGYAASRKVRINYFLGEDGAMHEYSRKEVES